MDLVVLITSSPNAPFDVVLRVLVSANCSNPVWPYSSVALILRDTTNQPLLNLS